MYSHFLIPTDGTDLSHQAVEKGVAFAAEQKAKVTLLYVQPDFSVPLGSESVMLAPETREDYIKASQQQAKKILEKAAAVAAHAGIKALTQTTVSNEPYEVIIETASTEGCDLIFMASHGRRGLSGLLLGSVTQKVLTHCKTPVLVCR